MPKGAYATTLLSNIFKLHEDRPIPDWVGGGRIDAKEMLGEGSLKELKKIFKDYWDVKYQLEYHKSEKPLDRDLDLRSIVSMSKFLPGVCATLRSLFEKFGKSGAVAQFGLEAFFHLGMVRMLPLGNTLSKFDCGSFLVR